MPQLPRPHISSASHQAPGRPTEPMTPMQRGAISSGGSALQNATVVPPIDCTLVAVPRPVAAQAVDAALPPAPPQTFGLSPAPNLVRSHHTPLAQAPEAKFIDCYATDRHFRISAMTELHPPFPRLARRSSDQCRSHVRHGLRPAAGTLSVEA